MYHVASDQAAKSCTQNQICAIPGDYLKYSAQVYGSKGIISYTFGSYIDSNTLKVTISTVIGNHTTNSQAVLNLKNTVITNSDGSKEQFFFMVLTPISPSIVSTSPFKEGTGTFNGYQRTILAIEQSNETDSQEVKVDKETGVLLVYNVSHVRTISGKPVVTGTSFTLVDTNLITSSNLQGSSESLPVIPSVINATESAPNAIASDNTTIIYIALAITAAGAGMGIVIMQKRKPKKVS